MKRLRNFLDKQEKHFVGDGKFKKFYPIFEMLDTFLYTPGQVTTKGAHIRDALDQKRLMFFVVNALVPCILWALYNTGYQANTALVNATTEAVKATAGDWHHVIYLWLGFSYDPTSILANVSLGAIYFIPVFLVVQVAGGFFEVVFAVVRKHEINEGFLVTGMLIPLILPPTTPLWQVALGTSFGVVIGKEIFGGVGKNILNPALVARAFLFFAYPAQMSGDAIWTAVDGFSGATPLAVGAAANGISAVDAIQVAGFSWFDSFIGLIPGSFGETSTVAALLGGVMLIATGIGSWRTMLACVVGLVATAFMFNAIGSSTNPMFSLPAHWHFVLGGYAFGMVFMATDPVSSAFTNRGKFFYGFMIGAIATMVRVVNPAFPEGMMLSILFANVFAPLIDYFVLSANKKRRAIRNAI